MAMSTGMLKDYTSEKTSAQDASAPDSTQVQQNSSLALSVVLISAISTPLLLVLGLLSGLSFGQALLYAVLLAAPFTIVVLATRKAICWMSKPKS